MTKSTLAFGCVLAFLLAVISCSANSETPERTAAVGSATVTDQTSDNPSQESVKAIVVEYEKKIWGHLKPGTRML